MKKIIQVVPGMSCGGIENFIMNMYEELLKMNVQFDFIYMCDNEEHHFFDEKIIENGGNIYYAGKPKIGNIFSFIRKFKAIIHNNGPYQALHVHSFYNCGFISLIAKLIGQKNIIVHSHTTKDNKNDNSLKRKMYIFISKKLIKIYSDKKLACGYEAGEALYDKSIFTVINNGINIERFNKYSQEDINNFIDEFDLSNKLIITHVGNFYDVKNHEYIIKIAEKLNEKKLKFKMLLVGTGELESKIKNIVKEKKLEQQIIFLGLRNDVEKILLASNIFILPSKYEGFPVSLIEAQAIGLSCVVSNKIDKSINFKVNDMSFIDIKDENIDDWAYAIFNSNSNKIPSDGKTKLKKLKMDSSSSAAELYKIYFE